MRFNFLYFMKFFIVLLLTSSVFACGQKKIPTTAFKEYTIPNDLQKQTKQNVTIQTKVIKLSEFKNYPELFKFEKAKIAKFFKNGSLYFPETSKGERWCYTFGFGENDLLTAMEVKIKNNTPHILRMKDSRIYLIITEDGEKKPIKAVTKLGDTTPVPLYPNDKHSDIYLPKSAIDEDDSLIHWITSFEANWERNREKGLIDFPYPVGFASQVIDQNKKNYKLINGIDVEILPDFSYSGILLFPVIVSYENPKLMFYDITTKTDPAGNPIEKNIL